MRRKVSGIVVVLLTGLIAGLCAAPATAQPCTVVHVNGAVRQADDGPLLSAGGEIATGDTLYFDGAGAAAMALCPDRGRVVIRPDRDAKTATPGDTDRSWMAVVSNALLEPVSSATLGTRGAGTIRTPRALARHFSAGGDRYLMLGDHEIPLGGSLAKRTRRGAAFVLTAPDSDTSDTLTVADGTLLLPRASVDRLAGASPQQKRLSVVLVTADDQSRVAAFTPALPPVEQVEREVVALARAVQRDGGGPARVRNAVHAFLADVYGAPYTRHVDPWLMKLIR
jgi:hypothetical protein